MRKLKKGPRRPVRRASIARKVTDWNENNGCTLAEIIEYAKSIDLGPEDYDHLHIHIEPDIDGSSCWRMVYETPETDEEFQDRMNTYYNRLNLFLEGKI